MNSLFLRRVHATAMLSAVLALFTPRPLSGQGLYYISRTDTLAPSLVTLGSHALPIPVNREDVKAIGMGRTQVADGRIFNAMMYNPALLAQGKLSIEALSIQASVPRETFDAAVFLSDHASDFEDAVFLNTIQQGIDDFNAAGTAEQKLASLQKIQAGLQFPRDLLSQVIGSSGNPKTHGVRLLPAIALQVGNFGLSLYGTAQSGFQIMQSQTLEDLVNARVPSTLQDPEQVTRAITDLTAILNTVIDAQGRFTLNEALPKAFAVSHIDVVGAAGYGFDLNPRLSLGANIKVVNRRFSTKRIAADNFDTILEAVMNDLRSNVTGVTLDLGALYHLESTGTSIGASLQNVLPMQEISSSATATFVSARRTYERGVNGESILNARGDTAIVTEVQKVTIESPFDLKLPLIVNLGGSQPLTRHWDLNLDWVDVTAQDERFERYLDRVRIGTEYRLEALERVLGIAVRFGLSDSRPTYGLGLNLFRVIQIDGAYAYDAWAKGTSYFGQVRIGW